MEHTKNLKKELRKKLIEKRDQLTREYREDSSKKMMNLLLGSDLYRSANAVFTFVSFKSEPDTHGIMDSILNDGKALLVPRTRWNPRGLEVVRIKDKDQLEVRSFGLLEPGEHIPSSLVEEIDLVLVPGLSFTPLGDRIGYGAGFYDRFLSELPKHIPTIGFVFDGMLSEELVTDPTDIPVKYLLTEKGLFSTGK